MKDDIMKQQALTALDRFEIFEQLNLHQRRIDNDAGRASAESYVDLYWPDAVFTVRDIRNVTFKGPADLKKLYDYAHSVFPIEKWSHSMGWFEIVGSGDIATATWRWAVSWKTDHEGIVSTGTYTDRFERRAGIWKCIERTSDVDPNWPSALFQPFVDAEATRFKES